MSGGPYSYNRFDEYQRLIEKKQGYNDREDESLGEKDGKESTKKQSEKDRRDEAKGEAKSKGKPDYIDIDGDGDKKESMKKAAKEVSEAQMSMYVRALGRMGASYNPLTEKKKDDEPTDERKEAADRADEEKRQKKEGKKGEAHETEELEKIEDKELAKEAFEAGWNAAHSEIHSKRVSLGMVSIQEGTTDVSDPEELMVMEALIDGGLATNVVSAETIMVHMSDEWFQSILAEMGPAYPAETKAQAKAQSDHGEGKSSKGEKTGKNPGLKMSHTSGYNRQD